MSSLPNVKIFESTFSDSAWLEQAEIFLVNKVLKFQCRKYKQSLGRK